MKSKTLLTSGILTVLLIASQSALALTDGEILKVMHTANEAEIAAGKYAKSNADRSEVRDFASMMVDQHKGNLKDEKKVCEEANLKGEKNSAASQIKMDSKKSLADLKTKKGLDFDKAYIANQVSMHQQLLEDLNSKFIPSAQAPELKAYLQATATHVKEHLDKARQIQTQLQ